VALDRRRRARRPRLDLGRPRDANRLSAGREGTADGAAQASGRPAAVDPCEGAGGPDERAEGRAARLAPHDHGDRAGDRLARQGPAEGEAIESDEVERRHDDVRCIFDGAVEPGYSVGRLDQVVSVAPQQGATEIERRPAVVDQENPRHLGTPLEASSASYSRARFGTIPD